MTKISLRYARGLLLAAGEKSLEELAENLDIATKALSEPKVAEFLEDPQTTESAKEQLVEKAFGISFLTNFLKLIVRNRKISEIQNIAESFRAVLSESAGVATAKIESATPLREEQITELAAALRKMTGKEIAVETEENSKLIGGVKIHLGDEMIDLSLAGKLGKLGKALA